MVCVWVLSIFLILAAICMGFINFCVSVGVCVCVCVYVCLCVCDQPTLSLNELLFLYRPQLC